MERNEKISSKIDDIQIKLNRLYAKKASLDLKLKTKTNKTRKSRTRTLIQVGGLVNMLGLLDYCEIKLGDDLQTDFEAKQKALILLGMLVSLQEQFSNQLTPAQIQEFQKKGTRAIKMFGKNSN
jgi:Conjugal transfer protein TraD